MFSVILFLGSSANSWEYRYRIYLLKWESFPRPLSPKNPLIIDNIGPLIALIDRVIIIIPLLICYKYERNWRRGWKNHEEREREKSDLIESLPRITQSRKLLPTIQVSCKPKLDLAQESNRGGAQLAPSVGISCKAVVW